MFELGKQSIEYHKKIVNHAIKTGVDGLIICATGAEAEAMFLTAQSINYVELVSTPEEAAKPLHSWLRAGDSLLIKASRSIGLERLLPLLPVV